MKYSTLIVTLAITIIIMDSSFSIPISPPVILYLLKYMCMFILIFLALKSTEFTNLPDSGKTLLKLFWFYSFIIVVYSVFEAQAYWDYKYIFINYIPSIIITFSIFIGLKLEENLNLFKFFFKILFPLGIFLSFFVWPSYPFLIAKPLAPIFLFILAFPFLKLKHQWLVLGISILSIMIALDWRTNIFRIIGCWLIVLLYYLSLLKPRLINLTFILIFFIPLIFLYLGIVGALDIFQFITDIELDLLVEKHNTRTYVYENVFLSIKDSGAKFFFGGSGVGGYISPTFYIPGLNLLTDKTRYGSEVAFLNTLMKSGIIGVIFDTLIFFIPAYFAINQSNNNFSKLLGFYLALSWLLYFLETTVHINLNNFFHYFIVGLCLSPSFRNSTDAEIKFFFKSI